MTSGRPGDRNRVLFESLFRGELPWMWNTLRRLGVPESDREDLLQEIFVRVHGALDTYDASRPPRPWLFAFAFRVASDHRKRAKYRVAAPWSDVIGAIAPRVEAEIDAVRRRVLLDRAIEDLDMDKRAVFVLHDLDEVPVPEIARSLGIPEGTAYTRLRAARTEVATALRRALPEGAR